MYFTHQLPQQKQITMKALYILIIPALLTSCSVLKFAQKSFSDLPKSEAVEMVSINKPNADKAKIVEPRHVDTLPPLSTTDFGKNSVLSTRSTAALVTTPDSEKLAPIKYLKVGSRGAAVLALEKRLTELDYDAGKVDGYYDKQTRQGVLAFQKYAELKRTGTYTQETQKALLEAVLPKGLHPELGLPRIEIDIARQILLYFDEKGLNSIIAVSTGSNRNYCERSKKSGQRVCGVALTPLGTFHIQRKIPGWRESDLGKLYNPLYFSDGFAIHGAPLVPEYNASHGCVRISIATSVWFYDAIKNGTPVILFD